MPIVQNSEVTTRAFSPNHQKRAGFVMVLALLVMGIMITLTMALVSLVGLETQGTGLTADRARAKQNALNALRLAIAQLQEETGRDQVSTIPQPGAEPGVAGWCYASRPFNETPSTASASGFADAEQPKPTLFPIPLVSGYFQNGNIQAPYGWTEFSHGKHGATASNAKNFSVRAAWMGDITPADNSSSTSFGRNMNSLSNRYAYWIEDESQKADAGTVEAPGILALSLPEERQRNRQLASTRLGVDDILGVTRGDIQTWREGLSKSVDFDWLELAWRAGRAREEAFPLCSLFHTPGSRGVLADARSGGLRINLDQRDPGPLPAEKLPCPKEVWDDFFARPKDDKKSNSDKSDIEKFADIPSNGFPITPAATSVSLRRFPILTYLRVRIGVFHTHGDAYNRIRFHVETQFWNPYPYPLTITEKDMLGLFEIPKGPILTIKNHNTGNTLSVDTSAFPVEKLGVAQTESDATMHASLLFTNATHAGISKQGFYSGEVFYFYMPDPVKQPQGLARTISSVKWYWQSDAKKASTPPANATDGNWLHATHNVEIRVETPPEGLVFYVREARGNFSANTYAKDYSDPVITLKNLHFRSFQKFLTGSEFDRPDSASYTSADARFGYALRLRTNDLPRLEEALKKIDPRAPVFDFDDPAVASLYEIIPDPIEGLNLAPPALVKDSILWDSIENKHTAGENSTGVPFADFRAFDRPATDSPLSIGTLRHLPLKDSPSGTANPAYPSGREKETEYFDKMFFAGAWPDKPPPLSNGGPAYWTRNPWLEVIPDPLRLSTQDSRGMLELTDPHLAKMEDAAAHCFIRGAFNVNTSNAEVWEALFARSLEEWRREGENSKPDEKGKNFKNVIPRLPYGLAQAAFSPAAIPDISDEKLLSATDEIWRRGEAAQGFRSLENAQLKKLAEETAVAVRAWQNHEGRGFHSLHEFACSGVLLDAIKKSGVNEIFGTKRTPAPFSAFALNPGDLLESTLPALTVRGDTFKIRARGAIVTPDDKEIARATLEATIQRFPEFFDPANPPFTPLQDLLPTNRHLGRRYRILHLRWLNQNE